MLELYFIRHGESEANAQSHIISGRSNHVELSDDGRRQSHALGPRLAAQGITFDAVYSSPAVRTLETGRIVGEYLGFGIEDIIQHDDLQEQTQGDWVGRLKSEIYTPEVQAAMNADNWNYRIPGAETQREVEERMYAWVEQEFLHPTPIEGRFAIFGHGMAIKCLLRKVMESDPAMTYKIDIENTGIVRLTYTENRGWSVQGINDDAHLMLDKIKK